ncbi:6728_t:CDS:1, partial [Racocetra persica]
MSSRTPSPNLIDFGNVVEDSSVSEKFFTNSQDSSDEDSTHDLESHLVEDDESNKELNFEKPIAQNDLNQYMERVRPLLKYLDELACLDQHYFYESSTTSSNFNSTEESDEQSVENIIGDDSFDLFNIFDSEHFMDEVENIEEETCPSAIDSEEPIGIDAITIDRTSDTFEIEAEGSCSAHSICPKSRMDLVLHKYKSNMTTMIDTSYIELDTQLEESYSNLRIEIKRCAQNLFKRTIQEHSNQIYTKVLSEIGNFMNELSQNVDTVLSLSHWERSVNERIRSNVNKAICEIEKSEEEPSYEERLNKLVDVSIGLESTTEEIKKAVEEKIQLFEIENQKLKEFKNNQKENMLLKESIIHELKLMSAHHESVASKLQENKS